MRMNNERISDLVSMDVPARLSKTLIDLAKRFGEPGVQSRRWKRRTKTKDLFTVTSSL